MPCPTDVKLDKCDGTDTGMSTGSRFFVYGGDESLDGPGEFTFRALNETHGRLKLIPPLSQTVPQAVVVPSMVTLVQYEDAADVLVSDVGFLDNGYHAQGYQVPTLVKFYIQSTMNHRVSSPTTHHPPISTTHDF